MLQEIEIGNYNFPKNEEFILDEICTNQEISYEDFFAKFLIRNLPCIIKNVTTSWSCCNFWVKNGCINYDYFENNFGDLEVPVADCKTISYNAHCKSNMKMKEYMMYLRNTSREEILYLKDWHLQRVLFKESFYEVPVIFASDWLNEYAQNHEEDDFMFVYIGPEKSWTPLHADVYNSYSWSVNIIGRKKWILIPPGEEVKLKDSLGNLPFMLDNKNLQTVKHFVVTQETGDAIFVPSGWYHQVLNVCDTISVNHNWINACNIDTVWRSLDCCLNSVENEIQEFRDSSEFASQCQLMLKCIFGMNFKKFIDFICHIAVKRINCVKAKNNLVLFNKYTLGPKHLIYDLQAILKVMNSLKVHRLFTHDDINVNKEKFISICGMINDII